MAQIEASPHSLPPCTARQLSPPAPPRRPSAPVPQRAADQRRRVGDARASESRALAHSRPAHAQGASSLDAKRRKLTWARSKDMAPRWSALLCGRKQLRPSASAAPRVAVSQRPGGTGAGHHEPPPRAWVRNRRQHILRGWVRATGVCGRAPGCPRLTSRAQNPTACLTSAADTPHMSASSPSSHRTARREGKGRGWGWGAMRSCHALRLTPPPGSPGHPPRSCRCNNTVACSGDARTSTTRPVPGSSTSSSTHPTCGSHSCRVTGGEWGRGVREVEARNAWRSAVPPP